MYFDFFECDPDSKSVFTQTKLMFLNTAEQ